MLNPKKAYTSPELVELKPDDPRAVRLRAELAELDRLAREKKPT